MKLKIAIVAHGRFHAFDLARALLRRGHDVTLFTNYPKWAVRRFDFPESRVRSYWLHGVISRAATKFYRNGVARYEAWFHTLFGRWAATELEKEHWDVVHSWSGVSEEILQALAAKTTLKLLMRGSAHIVTQAKLLEEEEKRVGKLQDRPSQWMIAREQREYELVDAIAVLQHFHSTLLWRRGFKGRSCASCCLASALISFAPIYKLSRTGVDEFFQESLFGS